jgi:hypothetical protein
VIVTTRSVVKRFNVIEHISSGYVSGFVDPFADVFFFQTAEKRLRHGIVSAVSSTTHTRLQVVGQTETLPVIAAILATLLRMHDDSGFGFTAPHHH